MHICTQYFYFHATAFVQSTVELIWWEAAAAVAGGGGHYAKLLAQIKFKTRTFSKLDSLRREYHVSSKAVNVSYNHHLPVDV